jgi:tetratricopeptide (TPR) repeat protein
LTDLRSGRAFTLSFLAVLAAAVGLAYGNSLRIGLEFDDWHTIQANPAIRSLRNLPRFFIDPTTFTTLRENVDVRPVLVTTFAINYAISGLHTWSYHAVNLLIHLSAAGLVFFIVRDFLWWPASERGSRGALLPATAASLFFALAPLNSQPVVYISARSALLCSALYLGAFLSFLHRRYVMLAVLHTLALLTKAIAMTLPLTVLLYDFLYRDRGKHPTIARYLSDWRGLVVPVGLPALVNVGYLVYRRVLLGSLHLETYTQPFTTPTIWFMSQWSAYLYYVRLFLWPDALSIDHAFPYAYHITQFRAWGALIVILAWITLALHHARAYPVVAFATLWFFLTLAPESSFAPLAEVVNDHRPYIASSLGLSVLLAWLLHRLSRGWGRHAVVAFATTVGVLCIGAIAATRHRNWQWQDSVRLWQDAVEKGPTNGRAWMNAGLSLLGRGDLIGARRYFEKARELTPSYSFVYMNLSALARREGKLDEALREAEVAVRLSPELSLSHYYRASALEGLGRVEEAAAEYLRAAEMNPRDPEPALALERLRGLDLDAVEMNKGVQALRVTNEPELAAACFRRVLERNPSHYGATYQLAAALDTMGKPELARPVWERALELAQRYRDSAGDGAIRQRLARSDDEGVEALMAAGLDALYERHDPLGAIAQFQKVLQRMPTHYGATYQLAAALDAARRPREARPLWEKVLTMAESYSDRRTVEVARNRLKTTP